MSRNTQESLSRRSILNFGAKAATTLGLSSLLGPIASAGAPGRACVCIYLLGGNDSNNMIVPLDSPAYDTYARGRGALALPAASLVPIRAWAAAANYGLHPALSGLQDLYNRGALSVVANVGRGDTALVKGQFTAAQLPADLFLHTGASEFRYLPQGNMAAAWDPSPSMVPASATLPNYSDTLSQQLGRIATELSGKQARTTYTVPLSGFDTHGPDQLAKQAGLFSQLNDGLVSFYQQLQSLGLTGRVTVFTASEFNRTLAPNARGGTDHAWGGHSLVLGGSVRGGQVYGQFPSLALGGPDDLGSTGVWIPSISESQFAAAFARWSGVSSSAARFPTARNLQRDELELLLNR